MTTLSLSSNGSIFAIASKTETRIKCYDCNSSHLKSTLFGSKENNKQSLSKLLFCHHNTYLLGFIPASNKVVVWDLIRGVESFSIKVPDGSEVRDITTRNDSLISVLMQSTTNHKFLIFEYDVSSGKLLRKIKTGSSTEKKFGKIQCSSSGDNYAVLIDKQIRIFNAESGKRTDKISIRSGEHFIQPEFMDFSTDELYLFHTVDRNKISIYSLENKKYSTLNIENDGNVELISINVNHDAVTLTFVDGTAKLILLEANEVKEIINLSAENGKILKALVDPSSPHDQLHVVGIDNDTPWFKKITYRSSEGKILLENNHIITKEDADAEISDRPTKRPKHGEKNDDEFEYNENDITIAERLQGLKQQDEMDLISSDDEGKIEIKPISLENTKSFAALLAQILQSNDDTTLERNILQSKSSCDRKTIVNSISNLSSHELNILLCKIVNKFALQPNRLGMNKILMNWMQAVLVRLYHIEANHMEDSDKEGKRALLVMRNMIMARVAKMEALTELNARLALLGGEF